jgi:hypothetical protein
VAQEEDTFTQTEPKARLERRGRRKGEVLYAAVKEILHLYKLNYISCGFDMTALLR